MPNPHLNVGHGESDPLKVSKIREGLNPAGRKLCRSKETKRTHYPVFDECIKNNLLAKP